MKLTQKLKVMLRALLVKAGELHAEKNGEAVTLIFDGPTAEVGVEVFVESQNGEEVEVNPAPDGEYRVDDKVYVVADGKIAEIKYEGEPAPQPEPEPEPEPEPDPTPDPDAPVEGAEEPEADPADNQDEEAPESEEDRLGRLEARVAEMTEALEVILNTFGELENRIASLEEKVGKLDEEPAVDPAEDREDMSETPSVATYVRELFKK